MPPRLDDDSSEIIDVLGGVGLSYCVSLDPSVRGETRRLATLLGARFCAFDSSVEDLDLTRRFPGLTGSIILAGPRGAFGDPLLFSLLDLVNAFAQSDASLTELPYPSIVTGRDGHEVRRQLKALCARIENRACLTPRIRMFIPQSNALQLIGTNGDKACKVAVKSAAEILEHYRQHAAVTACSTHGFDACANGGQGVVLCGLQAADGPIHPEGLPTLRTGVLSCGYGYKCPRGPHPLRIDALNSDVLFLATCNGVRLNDSILDPSFNLGLRFLDGSGTAFVSTLYTARGGTVASIVFCAALASGVHVGAATALVNIFLVHARIEPAAYLPLGDGLYRAGPPAFQTRTIHSLADIVHLSSTQFAVLTILVPELITKFETSEVVFSVRDIDKDTQVLYFGRIEAAATHDNVRCLRMLLFSFPERFSALQLEALDYSAISRDFHRMINGLSHWSHVARLSAIRCDEAAFWSELADFVESARSTATLLLPQLRYNGAAGFRMTELIEVGWDLVRRARDVVVHGLEPRLAETYWPTNSFLTEYCLDTVKRTTCPCHRAIALEKFYCHPLTGDRRRADICSRCGITWDGAADSVFSSVQTELPEVLAPGSPLSLSLRVTLRQCPQQDVLIIPRLSTLGLYRLMPDPVQVVVNTHSHSNAFEHSFVFETPEDLLPHRFFVKILLVSQTELAFVCRAFFVVQPRQISAAAPSVIHHGLGDQDI